MGTENVENIMEPTEVKNFIVLKADNNLDEKDNLNEIPKKPAVYGIFSRINGEPANCRFVGFADNLQEAIKGHFSFEESDNCLKQFMNSIKIKALSYKIIEDISEEEKTTLIKQWKEEHNPECSEELNKVY